MTLNEFNPHRRLHASWSLKLSGLPHHVVRDVRHNDAVFK